MKAAAFVFLLFLSPVAASAQERMTEPQQLGTLAGLAEACRLPEKDVFEEIALNLVANKSLNDKDEDFSFKSYATAKAVAYKNQTTSPEMRCSEIARSFSKMPVFRFELYSDGTIRTNDGMFIYPRGKKAKDPAATKIYPSEKLSQVVPASVPETAPQVNVMRPVANQMQPVVNRVQPVVNKSRAVSR